MKDNIIKNKNLIALIASIVAIALVAPELIGLFGSNFNDNVFSLILYASYVSCAVYILVYSLTKKELTLKAMILPVILLFGGLVATYIKNIIDFNSWSSVYYLALYLSAIIIYLLFALNNNEKMKIVTYILFLIITTFNLLSVLGGSSVGCARLILILIVLGNIYLNSNKKEEEIEE